MFKKRKNKTKQDILTTEDKQKENESPNPSTGADENGSDNVDGFDSEGFVDLTPPEKQPKLLGPKQNCQYIGTFAVSLGSGRDGEATLTTHRERTRFVKKKLREYRYAQKGVTVALLVSTDGIKVITPDGQRVRMAHALQRISFATCDPEFRLFAYMSQNPSPLGTAVHCHVFMTKLTRQVQNLTALVGKAFQLAFADSKFPKGIELKMEPLMHTSSDERVVQGRRWARLEAQQGHEHSEHAMIARLRKEQEKLQNKSPNTSKEQAMPTTSKEQITPKASKQEATPTTSSAQTPSSSHQLSQIPMGRRRSFGKVHTPPEMRKSNLLQRNGVNNGAVKQKTNLSDDVVTDSIIDGDVVVDRQEVKTSNGTPSQAADWKISAPPNLTQSTQVQGEKERPLSSVPNVQRERALTPPPSNSFAASAQQHLLTSSLAKSVSDPNLVGAEADGSRKHEAVSKRNSHEDENWYLPGIPREFVTEMLEHSEEGTFFVRDSQSRPGCFALTMRVPRESNPSGFANFLIVRVKDGVMIQGFNKVLADVTCLVEHYAHRADGLPCRLLIGGSNVLCEDEDYVNMVPDDPDYQHLSDFTAMMAELN